MLHISLVLILSLALLQLPVAPAILPPPVAADRATPVVDKLKQHAAALKGLVKSELAQGFLDGAAHLPEPTARTVYRTADKKRAISAVAYAKLDEKVKEEWTKRECSGEFYYSTVYGSPLIYARVVDVLAEHGVGSLVGKKVLDFGYGTIGHLRLLAQQGAQAHGVDVEPMFEALYSEPGDTGPIAPAEARKPAAKPGSVHLHTGQWPAQKPLAEAIGGGYDIITSKNTLKHGYIHPAREVDPKLLVHLGVEDAAFLKCVHDALRSDGLFVIYNISPAQNPADKPYLPHADGKCPFTKEQLEKAGFEVVAFDSEDHAKIHEYWMALGYDEGKGLDDVKQSIFAWYTVCRRP